MKHLEHLTNNKKVFFNFMNENYTIFQHSNLFFRDLQYALMAYFEMKDQPLKYAEAENLTVSFIKDLEENNELMKIDHKSWKVNFEVGITKKIAQAEGVEHE